MASLSSSRTIIWFERLVVCIVAGYAAASLFRIITTLAPDFSVLYSSAKNLRFGIPIYQDTSLYTGLGYPAVSLLPFIPFTWLPYGWAQSIWIVGSFAAFAGSCALSLRMARAYSLRKLCILMALAFMAFPTKFTFGMGQANFYALFFLLLGISDQTVLPWVRSMSLLLALLFKPHLIFVYVGLLLTKRKINVMWALLVVSIAVIILGTVTGWANDREYVYSTLPQLLRFRGREIYYNQGIQAGVARLFGVGGQYIATAVTALVLLLSFSRIFMSKKITSVTVVTILLPMQTLIEPLAWQHHLIFLLPTCVSLWFFAVQRDKHIMWVYIFAYCLVSWNIKNPLYWQGKPWEGMVLSHGLWGLGIIWYAAWRYL